MRNLLYLSLLFLCTSCSPLAPLRPAEITLQRGSFAPDFSLPDLDGKSRSLKSFRGRVVVIHFWATWCASCIEEMRELSELHRLLSDKGLSILAISLDRDLSAARKFVQRKKIPFVILKDFSRSTQRTYKAFELPQSFIVDKSGRLVLFRNSRTGELSPRKTGPREWTAPSVQESIRFLLEE